MKDEFNALLRQRQPGFLAEALGARVEQYYALEKDFPVSGEWGDGITSIWAEQLSRQASDAEVLLKYGKANGWLDGQAAAISHRYGKGRVTYIGAILDDKLTESAAGWMVQTSGVKPVFGPVPEGVEVSRRIGGGRQLFILVNYAHENRQVTLPHPMKALLSNRHADKVELAPYGVEVLVSNQ
jgi:beta-galactosidase